MNTTSECVPRPTSTTTTTMPTALICWLWILPLVVYQAWQPPPYRQLWFADYEYYLGCCTWWIFLRPVVSILFWFHYFGGFSCSVAALFSCSDPYTGTMCVAKQQRAHALFHLFVPWQQLLLAHPIGMLEGPPLSFLLAKSQQQLLLAYPIGMLEGPPPSFLLAKSQQQLLSPWQ